MSAMANEADQVVDLYQRHARAWASDRGDRLFEGAWLDRFLGLIPDRPRVLDIGCGSGEPIGRYLIGKGCAVTGVDASPEMIAMCAARFPDQDWRVADMRILSLGRRFDGLLAWDSFFHLGHDDQRRMFGVFRAHAGAGAALMFTSGPAHGVAMGSYAGEPLHHASLAPEEYRALFAEHGFAEVAHVVEDPRCGRRTIWLAQLN
jgi:SAM-dependent methyltransferase